MRHGDGGALHTERDVRDHAADADLVPGTEWVRVSGQGEKRSVFATKGGTLDALVGQTASNAHRFAPWCLIRFGE